MCGKLNLSVLLEARLNVGPDRVSGAAVKTSYLPRWYKHKVGPMWDIVINSCKDFIFLKMYRYT